MRIEGQFEPEKTICKWRWSYPVIMVDRGQIRTCDKTINYQLTDEDFKLYGTDAFINHPYLLERRREKLDGLRHKDCFSCIILEDKGLMSSRTGAEPFTQWMNTQTGENKSFDEIKYKKEEKYLRADQPELLEIALSNQCNYKCVYCSDDFSTEWERESVKFGDRSKESMHRNTTTKPEAFDEYFWLWFDKIKKTLKRIIFIGGEPLVNKNFLHYLEEINRRTPKDLSIHEKPIIQIISNFGIPVKKFNEFLDTVEELSKNYIVHLEVSGESFDKKTEYIRAGANWHIMVENITNTLERRFPNFRFGLQLAINNLCISSLSNLLEYAWELQNKYNVLIDYKENIVVAPDYLSPYTLGPEFEHYVDKCIELVETKLANPEAGIFRCTAFGENSAQRWSAYLPFMYSIKKGISNNDVSDQTMKDFYAFTEKIEHRRQMNFLKYFPEYSEFYEKAKTLAHD